MNVQFNLYNVRMVKSSKKSLISFTLCVSLIFGLLPVFPHEASAREAEIATVQAEISDAEHAEGSVIVKFKSDVDSQAAKTTLEQTSSVKSATESEPDKITSDTAVVEVKDDASVAEAIVDLRTNSNVEYAEPDYVVSLDGDVTEDAQVSESLAGETDEDDTVSLASTSVDDPDVGQQWYINDENSRVTSAWDLQKCDNNVTVAVLDSGYVAQTDLSTNVVGSINFTSSDETDSTDTLGHGTAVAGVLSAQTNNGFGIAGVSYNANLLIVRVFTEKENRVSVIVQGLQWIVENKEKYNVSIVNMSLATTSKSQLLADTVEDAYAAGILCVCASGNKKTDDTYDVEYPAALDDTLAVGNITESHKRNSSSKYGDALDVVAPGTNIHSLSMNGDKYRSTSNGTSCATPFTSAAAALCKAANPNATVDQLKNYLTSTAVDLGDAGKDAEYGNGQVDVYAAVKAARADVKEEYSIFSPADDSALEKLKARYFNALLNKETSVDVSDLGVAAEDIQYTYSSGTTMTGVNALTALTRSHPLFSTLCVGWNSLSFYESGGTISKIKINNYSVNWTTSLIDSFMTKYNEFLEGAPVDGTDVQKAGYVHDWICSHTTYSMTTSYLPDFAIGCIANGKALCAGYSYAYQFLCQQLGLECKYVSGTTTKEQHAWNKVNVQGQWFLVDCTWDGAFTSYGSQNFNHNYFLVNDTEFAKAGDGGHAGDTDVVGNEPVNENFYFANKFWEGVTGTIDNDTWSTDAKLTGTVYLTYIANGGAFSDGTEEVKAAAEYNAVPTETTAVPTLEDYEFKGWFTDEQCTQAFDWSQVLLEDQTLYAGWSKKRKVAPVRLWGADCYGTNLATLKKDIEENGRPNGVIVCCTGHYIDSLSAAALSGLLDYPIMLVNGTSDEMNSTAQQSIDLLSNNGTEKLEVIILGGKFAISEGIATQLADYDSDSNPERIFGDDGYDTNQAVYEWGKTRGDDWNTEEVLVATGNSYHDALGAGSYAAANKSFILLANPNSSNDALIDSASNHKKAVILGGTAAISTELENSLASAGLATSRFAGSDAYATNIKFVTEFALKNGMLLDGAGISTGRDYYDALGSSHLLAKSKGVMFLVALEESYNQPVYDIISAAGGFSNAKLFGGTAVVSAETESKLNNL
ncbi:MAG: S8 family serine peptidase [Phoenicibacter congonensis]|uniref:S8 family serine peptidase n=1 Tax=Phoenicibacter congonensis TaxID=1944646 RepID=A0AA43RHT5_9ACTN|nr:S8 family serine peptidase [Phoenicibacter congonensis]